jgi:ABC-type bacteriocin/lantibiotic exporter with double-glycine peptidase domain
MTSAVARLAGLPRRRLLAPEVVQTSAMDCGPASLKCLLEGFGVPVSYGRLREACQTDVDGTSIDVLEEVAQKLGLDAEQVMLPIDHLLLPSTDALPALIVWRNPDGAPHFVVVWRQAFGRVMVMDPGSGRRWMRAEELLDNLYVHSMPIPADAWRSWAESDEFQGGLDLRLRRLGARDQAQPLLARCLEDATWRSFAALDGAVRMIDVLVRGKSLEPGRPAGALLESAFERALADLASPETAGTTVPFEYWIASPAPPSAEGEEQVRLTGAVLVKVRGTRGSARAEAGEGEGEPEEALSPELEAALREPPAAPARELWRMLREDGILTPIAILGALVIAALGGAIEAILMRGMLDVGRQLGPVTQRLTAVLLVATLFAVLLALELPITGGMLRMGRRLETRLRVAFLSKIPRLSDRYFHSRPTSDMAHRCHAIHPLRQLPQMGGRLVRSVMDLLVTTTGLVWIDPRSWPIVLAAVVVSIALPWGAQSMIVERDLRVRSFDGSLTRFYLDALLGLFAVRTHGAERAVRTEHSGMLVDWARAAHDRLRASVVVEAAEQIVGFGLAVWLTFAYLARTPEPAAVLLLLYWALNVPVLGQEIAGTARSYPSIRNLMLRLLEPLGALEETDERGPDDALDETTGTFRSASASARGAHVAFRGVTVRAAGRTILEGVDLAIPPGQHVAVVGPSGAGKSSLVGILLGWHKPAEGRVDVDHAPLRGERLHRLRAESAWVDPAVQLWNRSMLENLEYGSTEGAAAPAFEGRAGAAAREDTRVGKVLEDADLIGLLERLPAGLQTELGEGGALVSGGEGQRVRLGRAMMRPASRLVILDEPFRGLDRERRAALLARARDLWRDATMLCVTHDVGETLGFDRVIVIEDGKVIEDGPPSRLRERTGSRYRALLDAEDDVRERLWRGSGWRRLFLRAGRVTEASPPGGAP